VMGSLLVGLYLVYPVYWAGYAGTRWLKPQAPAWGEPQDDLSSMLGLETMSQREAA